MNIAVILAGGIGNRVSAEIPKQLIKIDGKTILEHSINAFENHKQIDEIAVVLHAELFMAFERLMEENKWKKVKKTLIGGAERYESSMAAICAYRQYPNANLLLHDACRPLVSKRIINDVIKALEKYHAVTVAIPSTDTIYQVDNTQKVITDIPYRPNLCRAQTPQAFKVETIHQAYQLALNDPNFVATDDCGVVAKYFHSEKIYVVRGEESNMKLTYKEDIYMLETLMRLKHYFRAPKI